MQINWIELRNKKTNQTLRKVSFDKITTVEGGTDEMVDFFFDSIIGIQKANSGIDYPPFQDIICRINFNAAHHEYLWYLKNTAEENTLIVDEEELYNEKNEIILTRGFSQVTHINYEKLPQITTEKSMLYLFNNDDIPKQIHQAFKNIVYYKPTDVQIDEVLKGIASLPHGSCILLDGRLLSEPIDLTALEAKRNDIQIIAYHATASTPTKTLTAKGNMISCQ